MPRTARKKSISKIYHIMLRGINQQNIFSDDEDCRKFMDLVAAYKKKTGFELYAYCLMWNHVHLLVKEGKEELSSSMKRIGASYVGWYNWQYDRKGHLFQDRYRSEPVEDDSYLLTVLRYIHQNPIKAGLTKDIETYEWSSYLDYTGKPGIADTDFVLGMFAENKIDAIRCFIDYNKKSNIDKCLEIPCKKKTLSDKEIRQSVLSKYDIVLATLQNKPESIQNEVLKYLKGIEGSSLRQISRLTGFTVYKIGKV